MTFGFMHAGTTNNVITKTAFLHGTIRALTQSMSLLVPKKRVREIAEGIALSFGVDLEIELNPSGYLPVENNPQLADELMTYFEQVDGVEMIDCPPAMTGEDLATCSTRFQVLCSGWVWIRLIPFTILVSVPKRKCFPLLWIS